MLHLLNAFVYRWRGIDKDGGHLQGEIRAPNLSTVTAHLLTFGIQVNRIDRKFFSFRVKKTLTSQIRVQFTEQLSDLINSAIPMPRALNALQKAFSNTSVKTLIFFMRHYTESGQSLGSTLHLFPREFSLTYCQLIEVAEASGQLEKVLLRLADLEKKQILISNKIKKASFYPLLVLSFSFLIVLFLVIGIVPKFTEIFDQAKLTLPFATVLLVNVSKFLINHAILITFILICAGSTYGYFFQTSVAVKKRTWQVLLAVPGIGQIIKYFFLSRFSYGVSTLLQVGIPLTESIEILLKNKINPFYTEVLGNLLDLLKQGCSLSQALKSSFLFPEFMVYSIKMGEEIGLTVESLIKISHFYEGEIDRFVDGISIFLEPILMVILGLIISVFMIALYLPIFNLGNAI